MFMTIQANHTGRKALPPTKNRPTSGVTNELQQKLLQRLLKQGEAVQLIASCEVASLEQENHAASFSTRSQRAMTVSQVARIQAPVTVSQAPATVSQPSGNVSLTSGTVSQPSSQPAGTVSQPSGTLSQPSGTVSQPSGTVSQPLSQPGEAACQPSSQPSGNVIQAPIAANHCVVKKKKRVKSATKIDTKRHPKIYQPHLQTLKEDKKNRIAVRVVGKTNPNPNDPAPGRVLMVVGATGTGKSSVINGLTNYIYGVNWEDDFRYKLILDESQNSQTQSQTSWITAYTFYPTIEHSNLHSTITVIDTPGFGDTGGIQRDKEIVDQIKAFFSDQKSHYVDQLHAVAFVASASSVRLTATQKYIFDATLSIFGKDIESNIFFIATFADAETPPVYEAAREAKIPYSKAYKFNNSVLYTENVSPAYGSEDEGNIEFNKQFWVMGAKGFERFFRDLLPMEPRSLFLTREVLKEREHLEATVKGLQPQIKLRLGQIDTLQQERKVLEDHEVEINKNKDFKYTVTQQQEILVLLKPGEIVTHCNSCHKTCHYPCALPNKDQKKYCSAMDNNGNCTVCIGRCCWQLHDNTNYRHDIEVVTVEKIYDHQKGLYEAALAKKSVMQCLIDTKEKQLRDLNEVVYGMIDEMRTTLQRLKEIALKPNPLTQVQYIDLLIETEKQEAKPGFQERIKALNDIRERAELMSDESIDKNRKQIFDWRKILKMLTFSS